MPPLGDGPGFVRQLRQNFSESSEIQRFFPPKIRWSPKKRSSPEIETDFSAEIGNFNVFSAQNQVVPKKKKKVFIEFETDRLIFRPKSEIQTFEGGLFSNGGGYFQFFTKNRHQNHQNGAILHTSQANGGGSSLAPLLATLLLLNNCWFYGWRKVLLNVTALAICRSFIGFAGKLPSNCRKNRASIK